MILSNYNFQIDITLSSIFSQKNLQNMIRKAFSMKDTTKYQKKMQNVTLAVNRQPGFGRHDS